MGEPLRPRPLGTGQIMVVLSFTLALFFVVAFVTKSAEAYRLRRWSANLDQEIGEMKRAVGELQAEKQRRQTLAWADEALRGMGWVPEGVVRVVPIPVVGEPLPPPAPASLAREAAAGNEARPGPWGRAVAGALFDNPEWEAWKRLILGFDGEGDLYYNPIR